MLPGRVVEELQAWVEHLDAEGVANSGAYAMTGLPVSLVTFRDPDGIQLELIAFHVTTDDAQSRSTVDVRII